MKLGNPEEYVPSDFYLSQNSPNPYRDMTKIKYCLPGKAQVKLTLFDSKENKIKELVNNIQEAGTYEIKLKSNSMKVGLYYYQLEAFDSDVRSNCVFNKIKKMSVIK